MDPLLDIGGGDSHSESVRKKARRVMLQRLPAAEMFMHFLDLHLDSATYHVRSCLSKTPMTEQSPRGPSARRVAATELTELVLSEVTRQLVRLAVACRKAPAPQKWIGSSVALAFDEEPPERSGGASFKDEEDLRRSVHVRIFDWGRSELNTLEQHAAMTAKQQADRLHFWQLYVGGIDRLAWEAARAYRHRFGNAEGWDSACLAVFDFDSMTSDDFLGKVDICLERAEEVTVQLVNSKGAPVHGKSGQLSTITYSVAWCRFQQPPLGTSRLAGAWQVTIARANHLPAQDGCIGTSDPYVCLTSFGPGRTFRVEQRSTVVVKNLDPEWNEDCRGG
ncbi:unnamed protein product [Polarella glacialis]|uniref:C2 domain-containing protein n=1 Tax=Polarella glacialis TaxID=89957 RepID=A0A813GR83_POLGL|nr:unnamed protein product [Polarella glacialis]